MVYSLAVKVPLSSTMKVSCHAFASLAFEPVTSTNSSAKAALKAITDMVVSANSNSCQFSKSSIESQSKDASISRLKHEVQYLTDGGK
jgi:hypothetical protein